MGHGLKMRALSGLSSVLPPLSIYHPGHLPAQFPRPEPPAELGPVLPAADIVRPLSRGLSPSAFSHLLAGSNAGPRRKTSPGLACAVAGGGPENAGRATSPA